MQKHKSNSLDSNRVLNDATPVTLASVYDPKDTSKILKEHLLVLIDSGSSHSMAKASLFKKYKKDFLKKKHPHIKPPPAISTVNII